MANVGDTVRVLVPFSTAFPDAYVVEAVAADGTVTIAGSSFDSTFIEVVSAAPPAPPAPPPSRKVTRLSFRNRFTAPEKVAIELASLDDPTAQMAQRQQAALLRAYLRDVEAASSVDLAYSQTRAGVQALEAVGLLAAGRALQILDAPIQPDEAA